MGKLKDSESFAELSVLLDEPITCTILTATNVELGVIKKDRIQGDYIYSTSYSFHKLLAIVSFL